MINSFQHKKSHIAFICALQSTNSIDIFYMLFQIDYDHDVVHDMTIAQLQNDAVESMVFDLEGKEVTKKDTEAIIIALRQQGLILDQVLKQIKGLIDENSILQSLVSERICQNCNHPGVIPAVMKHEHIKQ